MEPDRAQTVRCTAEPGGFQGDGSHGNEGGRSARKGRAILDAARDLFLRHGYLGTSMDDIAATAKVSKQTVYKHFGDKRRLFVELLTGDMGNADAKVAVLVETIPDTQNLETGLRVFARAYLSAVMQPDLMRLRRLVIGEAERFPELAAAWYAHGPEEAYAMFAQWFELLNKRGMLQADDPALAAQHFNWLILSIPINLAMAHPAEETLTSEKDLHRYADEGVRVFLAAYASAPTQ